MTNACKPSDAVLAKLTRIELKPEANDVRVKLVDGKVPCGFPSPAMDYQSDDISVTDLFAPRREATFIVQAVGDSMADAGICEGDWLFVDRSITPRDGQIVLAWVDGEFTVKRLRFADGKPELHPDNAAANYPILRPTVLEDFWIEGVVISGGRRYYNH